MGKTINDIRAEALALSPSERASLAHDLILSLDDLVGHGAPALLAALYKRDQS